MADRGDVSDPELTFSLVLTPRILSGWIGKGKTIGQKEPGLLLLRDAVNVWMAASPRLSTGS